MSSSDSSDDENFQLFKEATDTQFINDSMFRNLGKSKPPKDDINKAVECSEQSLRTARNNVDDSFDTLNVTPQFQNYIAKKLSNILEKQIEESLGTPETVRKRKKSKKKDGIKLLRSSVQTVVVGDKAEKLEYERIRKNARKRLKKKEKGAEIDFRQVAVNPEDIINKTEIKHWSQWTRSKVFKYKKLKNGKLEYIQPEFELK